MPNTYVALATQTLGTATSSVTFNSISSSYTDLVLITSAKNNTGAQYRLQLSFNGDRSTSVYSVTKLTGNGSTAVSSRVSNATYGAILIGTIGSTNFDNVITHIMNYSNTTTNKTVLSRGNETAAEVNAEAGLWRSTAAITSLTLDLEGGINFVAGSTFSLYGIANADQGSAKATGGIITEDSTYWYHTFGASGAFIPKQSLTCDVLVVAGGGGGGGTTGENAGGGGAGGFRTATGQSLTATTYNVTVGGGGPGATTLARGTTGSNSVFSTITSNGGGGGGAYGLGGNSGGSGGGGGQSDGIAGSTNGGAGNTPSTSPSQGSNGGTTGLNGISASGGGGASAVGASPTGTIYAMQALAVLELQVLIQVFL